MIKFEPGNLFKMPQILKVPEAGMAFITMMVARLGGTNASPLGLTTIDGVLFLNMVIYAYFFIALVQLLGIFGGDRSPLQDFVFALCGFLFYLGVGGKLAAFTHDYNVGLFGDQKAAYAGLASMCILTSLVHLVDVVFSVINLKNA